jgi:hypothetical protein
LSRAVRIGTEPADLRRAGTREDLTAGEGVIAEDRTVGSDELRAAIFLPPA